MGLLRAVLSWVRMFDALCSGNQCHLPLYDNGLDMQLRSPHRGSDLFMCLSRSVWFAVQRQSLLHGAWRVCSIEWCPYPSNTPPLRKLPWVVMIDSLYSGKSNFSP